MKKTKLEFGLMIITIICWILFFIKNWELALLIFFIIWGNNLQIKKL